MALAAFLTTPAHAADFAAHIHHIDPPQKAPPLVFEDAEGSQHALSDYRGRYVLLNIWATWCSPCVREMPSLESLQKLFGPQLTVLPLSEDRGENTVSVFYTRHSLLSLPVAVDHAGIAPSALNLKGLPTTLLIDPQGFEVARIEGDTDWSASDALAFIRGTITGPHYP